MGIRHAATETETDFYTIGTDDPRRAHEAEHTIGLFEKAGGYAFKRIDADPATSRVVTVPRIGTKSWTASSTERSPSSLTCIAEVG